MRTNIPFKLRAIYKKAKIKKRDLSFIYNLILKEDVYELYENATLGKLAFPVVHDISTSISTIKGAMYLIDQSYTFDKKLITATNRTLKDLEYLISGTKKFLYADATEDFTLNASLYFCLKILRSEFQRYNVRIIRKLEPNITIKGKKILFERVILNILVNSIQNLDKNKERHEITVRSSIQNSKIKISISDNGKGIDIDKLNTVWDKNFSGRGSSGIGLYFIKSVIENEFNGKVNIKSELAYFTIVEIELPL